MTEKIVMKAKQTVAVATMEMVHEAIKRISECSTSFSLKLSAIFLVDCCCAAAT